MLGYPPLLNRQGGDRPARATHNKSVLSRNRLMAARSFACLPDARCVSCTINASATFSLGKLPV